VWASPVPPETVDPSTQGTEIERRREYIGPTTRSGAVGSPTGAARRTIATLSGLSSKLSRVRERTGQPPAKCSGFGATVECPPEPRNGSLR
jgi:hypothetical protein